MRTAFELVLSFEASFDVFVAFAIMRDLEAIRAVFLMTKLTFIFVDIEYSVTMIFATNFNFRVGEYLSIPSNF